MRKFKHKFWFLIDPLKQIAYGMAIYVLFAFAYSNFSHSAQCITQTTIWAFSTSATATRTSYQLPVMAGVNLPNNYTCAYLVLTGSEYQSLVNADSTNANNIVTVNNNATTANNNATTALNTANTANNNATTANNNATTANNNATTAINNAQTALDKANEAINLSPVNNMNNILNISNQDAQTLMYAILGLFVIAFVGRMYRKSVSIADSHED